MRFISIYILSCFITFSTFAQSNMIIKLWPGNVPGETETKHAAEVHSDSSKNVKRITNITDPDITVYQPGKNANGAGIIICPGGGYNTLAINAEGYEVAASFAAKGYTAFVLQYRVPQKQEGALQDAQRAIRMIRNTANEWKLDPGKIGIIGFSAGGNLAVLAATNFTKKTYTFIDNIDNVSSRPDFAILIYPAYTATLKDKTQISPQIIVAKDTPPIFIFMTADDNNDMPFPLAYALREQKLPYELHIYPTGGHGYGLRPGNPAAMAWPPLAEKWLSQTLKIN